MQDRIAAGHGTSVVPADGPSWAGLPPERLLLPFGPGPFRMAMGLVGCDPDTLVEIDDRYTPELAERGALLAARHADVFAAEPGSSAARAEVLGVLAGLLPRRHPGWFVREGDVLRNRLTGEDWNLARPAHDPLEVAGRLVQEDLCLLDVAGPSPVLSAAVLCAPSRWRLREKIGRPLAAVHGPVPLYADRLAVAVDRFMAALRPGKLVERFNWSVVDDGALFQTGGKFRGVRDPSIVPANASQRLFLRVERQTLMRLPRSGFVLFAIRVHSYPLTRVLDVPGAARDLAAAVRALPDSIGVYKSLPAFRDALLACLDARCDHSVDSLRLPGCASPQRW